MEGVIIILILIALLGKFLDWFFAIWAKSSGKKWQKKADRRSEEFLARLNSETCKRNQEQRKMIEEKRNLDTVNNAGLMRKNKTVQLILSEIYSKDSPPKAIIITNSKIILADQYTAKFPHGSRVSDSDVDKMKYSEVYYSQYGMCSMDMKQIDAFAYLLRERYNFYKTNREEGYDCPDSLTLYQEPPRFSQEEDDQKTRKAWFMAQ